MQRPDFQDYHETDEALVQQQSEYTCRLWMPNRTAAEEQTAFMQIAALLEEMFSMENTGKQEKNGRKMQNSR